MDVAALSLNVDSSPVVKATADLEKFAAASDRAAGSAGKLSDSPSTARLAQDYTRTSQAATQASGSIARTVETVNRAEAAMRSASVATAATSAANDNVSRSFVNADAQVVAYRNNLEKLAAANKATGAASATAATQVASVGVAGKATSAILTGLGGILGGIVGTIVGSLIGAIMDWVASLWEADDALQEVTAGADNLGAAQAALGKMFDLSTGKIKNNTQALRDQIYVQQIAMQNQAIVDRQKASSQLGDAGLGQTTALGRFGTRLLGIGGRRIQVENKIAQQEAQGRRFESLLTGLSQGAIGREEAGRIIEGMGGLSDAQRRQLQNAATSAYNSGTASQAARDMASGLNGKLPPGYLSAGGGSSHAARSGGRGGGKSDAEKTADLLRNAQADIAIEQNRAKAVELTALATAELEQKTKLLNDAASKGLKITPALSGEIDKLAKAYAEAKVAGDVAEATQAVTDEIQKQRDAIADQVKLIGLYGDGLARATREAEAQKKLRESLPKGEIIVSGNLTAGLSDDIENQNRLKRMADLKKSSEDSAYAMDLERAGLALTGKAALEYAFIVDQLNKAKRDGIELSPEEVGAIEAAGAAYAAQRYEIDQTAQRIADTRETVKGFYTDLIGGLRNGENAFKAFADAATNALNRVIDKLLDRTLDSFLDKLLGGGGGGLQSASLNLISSNPSIFANGGTFGTAQRFANGGTFTNSVVTNPTLFKFANGSKFGVMGEAGPEAVMPLTRGPNGKLGVQAHGGGGRGPTNNTVNVQNDYHIQGAITPNDIMAMIRAGGQATADEVKRQLSGWLQEIDRDGAVAV